jgi:hypothetical protein
MAWLRYMLSSAVPVFQQLNFCGLYMIWQEFDVSLRLPVLAAGILKILA